MKTNLGHLRKKELVTSLIGELDRWKRMRIFSPWPVLAWAVGDGSKPGPSGFPIAQWSSASQQRTWVLHEETVSNRECTWQEDLPPFVRKQGMAVGDYGGPMWTSGKSQSFLQM